ncbi:sodium:solute symporter family transporter [Methylobacillus flagellatus]|uniref:Na+/solute symporter n=1 Tax=Methylobacillus flagellatus (strain ATCC 51484 / DSM 6875 / VKM B-1610 / KT) TaxID=265072 RepID=Q1H0D4_METFK|nr:sodium:solute symporter [Methylobacillus flagellatus]ABE50053.1 Na+/solute symporter [Methylobacillus flagellatus KT]
MLSTQAVFTWLVFFAAIFAIAGIAYSRRFRGNLEEYIVARNSQGTLASIMTLLASSLGAWILFSPAQAATWGGLTAVIGYAIGAMSPRLAMIPLGKRMRELMPSGHSLTEFLIARYGKPMYLLALTIMLFYLFIAMSAEITAIAKMVTLLAPVPLWATAAIVLGFTLLYTTYGGLRASIFTDKVQIVIIIPLLAALVFIGWQATGGIAPIAEKLQHTAPQLIDLEDIGGIKAGLTFFVAILLTGIFHQGNWQRIYSAKDIPTMRNGFLLGGILVVPFIFIMGLFGLAFMAMTPDGDSSVALFSVIMPNIPLWLAVALIPLGISLVMCSVDTAISAISSIVAVDIGRVMPRSSAASLMRLSRWLVLLVAIPVLVVAAQGYSVLYLFLLADLLCAAAAFPVFFGLFSRSHTGREAVTGTVAGLAAGLFMFPMPYQPVTHLLESFLLAALAPVVVITLMRLLKRRKQHFDLTTLNGSVRKLDGGQL